MRITKSLRISIFLIALTITSCSKEENNEESKAPEIGVTSVTITAKTQEIDQGSSLQLSGTVLPAEATDKSLEWKSSNVSIATVNSSGLVSALKTGEVTITVKSISTPSVNTSLDLVILGTDTNAITSLSVNGFQAYFIAEHTIGIQLPVGTDLTGLQAEIQHNGQTVTPAGDTARDFTEPVIYTVTAENGEQQEWVVKIIAIQPPQESPGFITTWVTTNLGTTGENQITIPTTSDIPAYYQEYNFNVDWGDGSTDTAVTGNIIHTYEIPGTYSVAITGIFPHIFFNASFYGIENDCRKLIRVDQWGDIQWNNFSQAFKGCMNMDIIATDVPDLSNVFATPSMFRHCAKLVGNSSFENWDVSNVSYASFMFAECFVFNQDIGGWNVSNMVNMSGFLENTQTFNQDIGNWDLSNVEEIKHMFSGATAFNQDINNWYFPKVTDLTTMFQGAEAFNKDISSWDVSQVEDFSAMFNGAGQFNQPIGSWDMSNAVDLSLMFQSADSFTSDITQWDVSNARNIAVMFGSNHTFNQDISGWDVSNVESMGGLFWNNSVFNQDLSNWDTSSVTVMQKMFKGAVAFDQSLGAWDISNVENMLEMFDNAGLSTANYDATLAGWNSLVGLKPNVQLDGGSSTFCNSEAARQNLINTYGWIFNDAGKDCN
jgi:surface protein